MNKFKCLFIFILCVLSIATLTFTVSCKKTNYYTITLNYDASQGKVAVSSPSNSNGYTAGEDVIITITPNKGYECGVVTANVKTITMINDDKYFLTVSENTIITVTFKAIEHDDPQEQEPANPQDPDEPSNPTQPKDPIPFTLGSLFYGTFKAEGGSYPDLTINETGIFWGDNQIFLSSDESQKDYYSVTATGKNYELFLEDSNSITINDVSAHVIIKFKREEIAVTYKINLLYFYVGEDDAYIPEMGSATYTPKKEFYNEGEEITLNITPGEGYIPDHITVNNKLMVSDNDREYKIIITENTEIKVFFKEDRNLKINDIWIGEWQSIDGKILLSISSTDATLSIDGINKEVISAKSTEEELSLTTLTENYNFGWHDGLVKNKIITFNEGNSVTYIIPTKTPEISEDLNGIWYNYIGEGKFSIDAAEGKATFDDKPIAIVECGYQTALKQKDGSSLNINHECYYLVINNDLIYFLAWFVDKNTEGEEYGRQFNDPMLIGGEWEKQIFINEIYIDPLIVGTWKNFEDPQTIIEADEKKNIIKINDQNIEVFNNGGFKGNGNIIRIGENLYNLYADKEYNRYLIKESKDHVCEYFLNAANKPLKIPEEANLRNSEWNTQTQDTTISFDSEGTLSYNGVSYNIYIIDKLDDCYKIIAISVKNHKIELKYNTKDAIIEYTDGAITIEYYKKTTSSGEEGNIKTGFLGLPLKVLRSETNQEVEIKGNSMIFKSKTFGYQNEPDLEITRDMLTSIQPIPYYNSNEGYQLRYNHSGGSIWLRFYLNGKIGEDSFILCVQIGRDDYLLN